MSLGIPKTNTISVFFRGALAAAMFAASVFVAAPGTQASHSWDYTNILPDQAARQSGAASSSDIESFLVSKGSAVKGYTIPSVVSVPYKCDGDSTWKYKDVAQQYSGKLVSQAIAESGQTWGINPWVSVVNIQKESSAITSGSISDITRAWILGYGYDGTMDSAGYSCADINDTSSTSKLGWHVARGGIGNQIGKQTEWFDTYLDVLEAGDCTLVAGSGTSSACSAKGQSGVKFGDQIVVTEGGGSSANITFTPQSRFTMLLYRYTPYIYNGNHNFDFYAKQWIPVWGAGFVTQSSITSSGTSWFPTLGPGMSVKLVLQLKNTGTATWQRGIVNLGTDRSRDRIPGFIREGGSPSGWLKENRVEMVQGSVAPGGTGTFEFWYTVPANMTPGTYREYFRPVADGVQWMDDWGIYWDVKVISKADSYRARWYSQDVNAITLARGEKHQFEVKFENTGISTWTRGTVNLGTDRPRDRIPGFLREGGSPSGWLNHDRIEMVEASVPPGGVGTFRFWYTVTSDKAPGVYKEYFRPVADFISWLDDFGVYFEITVP